MDRQLNVEITGNDEGVRGINLLINTYTFAYFVCNVYIYLLPGWLLVM